MKSVGYLRVSTARQAAEGESLEVQRRQLEGYALMQGLTIDAWFIEEGVSGSIPLANRPRGREMFEAIQPGDIIVSSKLDRLFRSALDALSVMDALNKRGIRLHLLDLGGDLSRNGMGRLFLTIAAAFAEAERDRIRERICVVKSDQRARSRYLGGAVPFGFRVSEAGELVPYQPEQDAMKIIAEMRSSGWSLRTISRELQTSGIKISHAAVGNIIRRQEISKVARCHSLDF